jgi:hypothetical protein
MALERVPADIRKDGGVARMSDPKMIKEIKAAVTIPVMAKARIGHFVECQILQEVGNTPPREEKKRRHLDCTGEGKGHPLIPQPAVVPIFTCPCPREGRFAAPRVCLILHLPARSPCAF